MINSILTVFYAHLLDFDLGCPLFGVPFCHKRSIDHSSISDKCVYRHVFVFVFVHERF